MHPYLRLGDSVIAAYPLFFVLGWLAGGVVFYLEVRRRGWPVDKMFLVAAGCVLGALVGALLAGALFFDWREVLAHATAMELVGKSVVGGIAGGFIGVEIAKKLVRYPHSTGDAFAIAIPIGHAIGRIGCFLGGCCYGTPTSLPWGVRYPAGSLPIHPTPLYELGFDLLLFAFLFAIRDRLRVRGSTFRVYLLAYATFRFFLEFVRGDSPFPAIGGPKPIQIVLALAAARYAVILFRQWRDEKRQSSLTIVPRP
jgi:phosphatidylglycerol---prolipoprotein diacylglyceryl transferase